MTKRRKTSPPPRTEREKMLGGEFYNSRDPELLSMAHRGRGLLAAFNACPSVDGVQRNAILTMLLGRVGTGVWIESPFFCDYGPHITIGDQTFVNVNCVFLDSARIEIGAHALIGPGVQLLTAFHPLAASERIPEGWTPESGQSPYRTQARPIRIGDRTWLGAGALVMPGVTIGAGTTIGAGSVVTADVPPNVLAVGSPCRVVREL